MWIKKIFERSVEFKFKGITYEHQFEGQFEEAGLLLHWEKQL